MISMDPQELGGYADWKHPGVVAVRESIKILQVDYTLLPRNEFVLSVDMHVIPSCPCNKERDGGYCNHRRDNLSAHEPAEE